MILEQYLEPVNVPKTKYTSSVYFESLFYNIDRYNHSWKDIEFSSFDIALLGIPEDRNTPNSGTSKAPDLIREHFYELYKPVENVRIIDLGNLRVGYEVNDTYVALKDVVEFLKLQKVTIILLGGSSELIHPVFSAYKNNSKEINICNIDSRLDYGDSDEFNSLSYFRKIKSESTGIDFKFTNIGYQTYYCAQEEINELNNEFCELIRLGIARTDITTVEPYIRDSDILLVDISSVRSADAPGHYNSSIHGFSGEELCQIAKYSGINEKLDCFGIFEVNPDFDLNDRTSKLGAQLIWHFIQGFYLRKKEYPITEASNVLKYIVYLEGIEDEMIFYKSELTDRWWFEIPFSEKGKRIFSCSHQDYTQASQGEIPEKWWKLYKSYRISK